MVQVRYLLRLWAVSFVQHVVHAQLSCNVNGGPCNVNGGPQAFTLVQKWKQSPNAWVLRFSLPTKYLGDDPTLPTCIAVHYNGTAVSGESEVLKKSYSPISHPSAEGTFDLLVKAYPPQPGGGVGAHICAMKPGEAILAALKSQRIMHGSPSVAHRWARLGLVAGGTGLAPLVQIARIILQDPNDMTKIQLLSINRREEDILMRTELDLLAKDYSDRFSVSYSLTGSVDKGWTDEKGRGSVAMVREALPPPTADGSTMILICGTDGFVQTWAGPISRAPPKADGTKGPKIQGPLLGILKDVGYDASEVFKY